MSYLQSWGTKVRRSKLRAGQQGKLNLVTTPSESWAFFQGQKGNEMLYHNAVL
jgi:hypothetical protein